MSTNIVRSSGDYKIQTGPGGTITLDTGSDSGLVTVIGNLTVSGTTTLLNTTDLSIEDNIITLNKGETGAGVSEGTSGISIDRGTLSSSQIIWDETQTWRDPISGQLKSGLFTFKVGSALNGIRTNSIDTNGGKLNLIGKGTGVVSVSGTDNYETQIGDDDDIPNLKYVNNLFAQLISQGGAGTGISLPPTAGGYLQNNGYGSLQWVAINVDTLGLGNVTNESKATMFTNPVFTGTATAPTPLASTNNTQISTTEYVTTAITNLIAGAPDNLNNLLKIASQLTKNTIEISSIKDNKAPLVSPQFTGVVKGITQDMVGLDQVTNESKATMFNNPTFTGSVSGISQSMVGLSNVTNESKATMFASPVFTGHPQIEGVTATGATGTGNIVFSENPILNNPTITGTTNFSYVNNVRITPVATGSTFTLADLKTFTVNNTITLSGTDDTVFTMPITSGNIPLDNQTFYLGTTPIKINRASASISLTGITSINGYAGGLAGGVLGSVSYQSAANTSAFVAPNTTTIRKFFSQTGNGSLSDVPAWTALASTDLPNFNIGTTNFTPSRASALQTLTGVSIDGTSNKSNNLVGANNTTLLGSVPYQSDQDTTTLLAPNTATQQKVLTQTGTGVNGVAPQWSSDISLTTLTVNGVNITGGAINDVVDLDDLSFYTDGFTNTFTPKYNGTVIPLTSPFNINVYADGAMQPAFDYNYDTVWMSHALCSSKGYTIDPTGNIKFADVIYENSQIQVRTVPFVATNHVKKVYPFKPLDIMLGF